MNGLNDLALAAFLRSDNERLKRDIEQLQKQLDRSRSNAIDVFLEKHTEVLAAENAALCDENAYLRSLLKEIYAADVKQQVLAAERRYEANKFRKALEGLFAQQK